MALDVICSSCGNPVEVEYRYDRVVIHQCPKCKAGVTIIAHPPGPPATAANGRVRGINATTA